MGSNLNFLFALLVVILIITIALASRGCGGHRIPSFIDPIVTLDEAQTRSGQSGKPVFALVATDSSDHCNSFKRGALSNSKVVAFLKANTEPVYIDASRYERNDADTLATMSRLGVTVFPTVVIMGRGQQVDRVEGDIPAGELLKWLEETIKPAPK